jgi:hypothetical protein
VLTKRGTERLRRSRDGESDALVGKVIFTGHLRPLKRVRLSDAGEVMVGEIRCPDRGHTEPVTLPPEAWETRSKFKGSLPSMDFAWYGTDDELQAFMLHLSREACPRVRGVRVLGMHPLEGDWGCVFSDRTLLPDGASTDELIHFAEGDTGFSWELGEAPPAPKREDLKGFATHILEFNATGKAASIVGWLMALPFKARLAARATAEFPILFCWGPRGSGKSQYQERLALRFYSGGQTHPKKLDDLTPFTHLLSASASNLVPWCIDEYKGRGVAMDARHEALLSSTLRRAYNQLEGSRGNKDGRTLKRYRALAPIFLAGEDNITEPAVLERVVEVFLSTASREGKREHWLALRRVPLEAVGVDYVRWSLTVSDARLLEVFQTAQADVDPRLVDRLRHNAAVVVFGLRLLGMYLEARGMPLPPAALRSYEEEAQQEQIRARFPEQGSAKNPSLVDNLLVQMAKAAAVGKISRGFDYELEEGGPDSVGAELYLRLYTIWPKFKEWVDRTRWEGETLKESAFRRQLSEEPYCLERRHQRRFSRLLGGNNSVKCVRLDYTKMLALGLEVEGFGEQA